MRRHSVQGRGQQDETLKMHCSPTQTKDEESDRKNRRAGKLDTQDDKMFMVIKTI